jgi:hypothetical protein
MLGTGGVHAEFCCVCSGDDKAAETKSCPVNPKLLSSTSLEIVIFPEKESVHAFHTNCWGNFLKYGLVYCSGGSVAFMPPVPVAFPKARRVRKTAVKSEETATEDGGTATEDGGTATEAEETATEVVETATELPSNVYTTSYFLPSSVETSRSPRTTRSGHRVD